MGFMQTDIVLASGTGFIYVKDDEHYLITAWHNVAGRDPVSGKCLSDSLAVPDIVTTLFREPERPGNTRREILSLYRDANMCAPAWYEHPIHRRNVDVIALPLAREMRGKYRLFPINAIAFDSDIKEEVADDTFVVGYPFSDLLYAQLPIWKRASIASEPDIDLEQLPKMFVDTATRSGLSGSPVVMQRVGIHGLVDGLPTDSTIIGRIRKFVGVYTGRVGDDELKAQLGIVWKARTIDEIIDGKTFGLMRTPS